MKSIVSLIFLLFILLNISTAQDSIVKHDFVGRIDESLLKVIVNIRNGSGTGTGFIIKNDSSIFLVTNKHMIGHYSIVDSFILSDSIIVYFYPSTQDSSIRKSIYLKEKNGNPSKNLILHSNPDVDIAVVKLNEVYDKYHNISKNYLTSDYLIPIDNISKITNIGFGSQVFAIGYPNGLKFEKSNYPIAKAAFIASSLSGKLEIKLNFMNRKKINVSKKLSTKFFLVDGLIIGGNSGGPIVAPKDFKYNISDKFEFDSILYPGGNSILGIVSIGWGGTGLTVIYPCDYILELIK